MLYGRSLRLTAWALFASFAAFVVLPVVLVVRAPIELAQYVKKWAKQRT